MLIMLSLLCMKLHPSDPSCLLYITLHLVCTDVKSALGKKRRDGKNAPLKPLTTIQRFHVHKLIEKYGDDYQVRMRVVILGAPGPLGALGFRISCIYLYIVFYFCRACLWTQSWTQCSIQLEPWRNYAKDTTCIKIKTPWSWQDEHGSLSGIFDWFRRLFLPLLYNYIIFANLG